MRTDLQQAKKQLLEPFQLKDISWFEAFCGEIPQDMPNNKESASSDENPKLFQKLLPLKSILSYWDLDKEWLGNFLLSKQCGGTLRKHIFINALYYHHEFLVNYLWSKKYRGRIIVLNTRNRSFLALARDVAKHSGYHIIHEECKSAYDELKEKIKAARVIISWDD